MRDSGVPRPIGPRGHVRVGHSVHGAAGPRPVWPKVVPRANWGPLLAPPCSTLRSENASPSLAGGGVCGSGGEGVAGSELLRVVKLLAMARNFLQILAAAGCGTTLYEQLDERRPRCESEPNQAMNPAVPHQGVPNPSPRRVLPPGSHRVGGWRYRKLAKNSYG